MVITFHDTYHIYNDFTCKWIKHSNQKTKGGGMDIWCLQESHYQVKDTQTERNRKKMV